MIFKKKSLSKRSDPDTVFQGHIGKSKISVGRFSYGYHRLTIREWGEGAGLSIGAFCSIADSVTVLLGGNHRTDWGTTFPFGHVFGEQLGNSDIVGHPATNGDVVIGNDVWIGAGATILSGVSIGDGAVIAANSMVGKDIGAYEIWAGNPATYRKDRFTKEIIDQFLALRWWELDTAAIQRIAPLLSQPPSNDVLAQMRKIVDDALGN